jgi:hypothetical protein
VIGFEDLSTLDNSGLRHMKRRGNRFPKYFKGMLRVGGMCALAC